MVDENGKDSCRRSARARDIPKSCRNLAPSQPWYDGSQLQFLKQYEPFPYGISTLALAYNDYKQAQLLQTLWNQHHIQTGDTVVDARPAARHSGLGLTTNGNVAADIRAADRGTSLFPKACRSHLSWSAPTAAVCFLTCPTTDRAAFPVYGGIQLWTVGPPFQGRPGRISRPHREIQVVRFGIFRSCR